MPQRPGQDDGLLRLAGPRVPRGEQLPRDRAGQVLGDQPLAGVIGGTGRGGESEPGPGVQAEVAGFGLPAQPLADPGLSAGSDDIFAHL